MIFIDAPALRSPNVKQASLQSLEWRHDNAFAHIELELETGEEDWLTLIIVSPIRIDLYRDEIDNLGDQEPLHHPEIYTELYKGTGLGIRQTTKSAYLQRYLSQNEVVKGYAPKARHIRVDTGWSELHVITNDLLQILNGKIKPEVCFFDAH